MRQWVTALTLTFVLSGSALADQQREPELKELLQKIINKSDCFTDKFEAEVWYKAEEPKLARFIASKGSVTLDGVSLTVNAVSNDTLEVMVIPHTLGVTTLGALQVGDRLNLEVDQMARYAARLMEGK